MIGHQTVIDFLAEALCRLLPLGLYISGSFAGERVPLRICRRKAPTGQVPKTFARFCVFPIRTVAGFFFRFALGFGHAKSNDNEVFV